jgi:hypothetical protein
MIAWEMSALIFARFGGDGAISSDRASRFDRLPDGPLTFAGLVGGLPPAVVRPDSGRGVCVVARDRDGFARFAHPFIVTQM